MGDVVWIVFVGVGFAFKADVVVGFLCLETVLHQAHEVLYDVPQVETDVGHFPLLHGVDGLVVQFVCFHLAPFPLYEDSAEEIEPVVGAEGDETIVDNFHGYKVSHFFFESPTGIIEIMDFFVQCVFFCSLWLETQYFSVTLHTKYIKKTLKTSKDGLHQVLQKEWLGCRW